MPDANGKPIGKHYDKPFRTNEMDQQQPRFDQIGTELPEVATQTALKLLLPEPLDHALLQRVITVEDSEGNSVAGNVQIEAGELEWHFVPEEP